LSFMVMRFFVAMLLRMTCCVICHSERSEESRFYNSRERLYALIPQSHRWCASSPMGRLKGTSL